MMRHRRAAEHGQATPSTYPTGQGVLPLEPHQVGRGRSKDVSGTPSDAGPRGRLTLVIVVDAAPNQLDGLTSRILSRLPTLGLRMRRRCSDPLALLREVS